MARGHIRVDRNCSGELNVFYFFNSMILQVGRGMHEWSTHAISLGLFNEICAASSNSSPGTTQMMHSRLYR
jgi:hypothetical protein